MDTILTYIGSKKRFFPIIKELIPKHDTYIEPFAGGFSLGLELLEKGIIKQGVLNDLDENVYNFWSQVKQQPLVLANVIDNIHYRFLELETEEDVVDFNLNYLLSKEDDEPVVRAAKFRMQKHYNRGTSSQKLTEARLNSIRTPTYGIRYSKITENLLSASMYLQDFDITNKSYEDLKYYDSETTFWYLDPPYEGAKNSNYYEVCGRERQFNQEYLRDFLLNTQGYFVQSNFATPIISALYKDFHCHDILVPSRLSSGMSHEVLITNLNVPFPYGDYFLKR